MLHFYSRFIMCKFHEQQFYKPRLWSSQIQGAYTFTVITKIVVNLRLLTTNTKRHIMKPVKKKRIKKPYKELIQVLEKYQRDLTSSKLKFHLVSSNISDIPKEESSNLQMVGLPKMSTELLSKQEKSKTKKSKKKKKDENINSSTRLARESSYFASLKSYITVCLHVNMHQQAHRILKNFKFKDNDKTYSTLLINSGVFELMIQGWASKGNLNMLLELTDILKENGFKFSLSIYSSFLECLNRQPVVNLTEIDKIHKQLQADGYCFQDIFDKCKFVGDQREQILQAIRKLIPNYSYKIPIFPTKYSCNLLEKLNEDPSISYIYPGMEKACTLDDLQKYSVAQFELEKIGQIRVKNINHQQKNNEKTYFLRKQLESCEKEWREVLRLSFLQNLECVWNQSKYNRGLTVYPYLAVLDVNDYVDVMMQEIKNLALASETYSCAYVTLSSMIGEQVMLKYMMWVKKQNGVTDTLLLIYQKYLQLISDPEYGTKYTSRDLLRKIESESSQGLSIDVPFINWPYNVLIGVGKFLLEIIIHEVQISPYILKSNKSSSKKVPAFYKIFRQNGFKLKEETKPHPLISELYRVTQSEHLTFSATVVPMSSPPFPWISPVCGGYLLMQTHFVRQIANQFIVENYPLPELYPCMDSLNVLGICPWSINKPVLDLIIDLFNRDGSKELDVPQPPHVLREPDKTSRDNPITVNAKLNYERLVYRQKKAEMYSLWCDTLYKLSIANHFRDQIFWFPHNMDFRGRVYPTPPHFNHLGSDLVRGILLFANGKPLGENGLNWLKIHAINLTGTKKRESVENRLKYADEIISDIIDSADRPFEGNKWWMKSEEPWQTLACCMEIAKAIRSPDPKNYICHFPVHQDGSCNGLQHYSALGRDFEGAQQVNLYPSSVPQDVYTGVANLVEEQRAVDAAAGLQIAQALEGFVTRKVVKQTVMTIVYGVTRFGARLQINKRLQDIEDFPDEYAWAASMYLVTKTFHSIQKMFTATRHIQNWFTECAQLISKVKGEPVCWVTPLGFPIMQPYQKHLKQDVYFTSKAFNKRTGLSGQPNTLKQKNAFPPNFIHSLDSSHMMLTSLFCQRERVMFQAVHDCFWTHPNTVDTMNKICREQFVALHSQPILENLSKFLVENFAFSEENINAEMKESRRQLKNDFNNVLVKIPSRGNFNLESVLYSTYFFS